MTNRKKLEEVGKILACLLVSKQGFSSIQQLENDYFESEGHRLPILPLGFVSSLDLLRSLTDYVRLVPRYGGFVVGPVVSNKIQHVNSMVARQRPSRSKRGLKGRFRSMQYFPRVRDPQPFIPNSVRTKIGRFLEQNPSGLSKMQILRILNKSLGCIRPVTLDNVDDFLNAMSSMLSVRAGRVHLHQDMRRSNALQAPCKIETITKESDRTNDGTTLARATSSNGCESTLHRTNELEPKMTISSIPGGSEEGAQSYCEDYDDEDFYDTSYPNISMNDVNCIPDPTKWTNTFEPVSQENHSSRDDVRYAENLRNAPEISPTLSDNDSSGIISPRIKERMRKLAQKYADGIWCADLLRKYSEEYSVSLDVLELGFASVCEFASDLKDVFHLKRLDDRGDFRLYDATKPLAGIPPMEPDSNLVPDWAILQHYENDDDTVEPIPMELYPQLPLRLIPNHVMTVGESVGQERIPDIAQVEIFVAEVFTPSLFWIQLRKKNDMLQNLMTAMNEFYESEGDKYKIPIVILEKGLNCACIFANEWHRAIIKTVKSDRDVTVIFYDYGTIETYRPQALRFLHRKWSNLPAQGIAASLYNLMPIKGDRWTKSTSLAFLRKIQDIPLIALICDVDEDNNSALVSLVNTSDKEDIHVNDWMVEQKHARFGMMGNKVDFESRFVEDEIACKILDDRNPPEDVLNDSSKWAVINPRRSPSHLNPPPGFTNRAGPIDVAVLEELLQSRTVETTSMDERNATEPYNFNTNPFWSPKSKDTSASLIQLFGQFLDEGLPKTDTQGAENDQQFLSNDTRPKSDNVFTNKSGSVSTNPPNRVDHGENEQTSKNFMGNRSPFNPFSTDSEVSEVWTLNPATNIILENMQDETLSRPGMPSSRCNQETITEEPCKIFPNVELYNNPDEGYPEASQNSGEDHYPKMKIANDHQHDDHYAKVYSPNSTRENSNANLSEKVVDDKIVRTLVDKIANHNATRSKHDQSKTNSTSPRIVQKLGKTEVERIRKIAQKIHYKGAPVMYKRAKAVNDEKICDQFVDQQMKLPLKTVNNNVNNMPNQNVEDKIHRRSSIADETYLRSEILSKGSLSESVDFEVRSAESSDPVNVPSSRQPNVSRTYSVQQSDTPTQNTDGVVINSSRESTSNKDVRSTTIERDTAKATTGTVELKSEIELFYESIPQGKAGKSTISYEVVAVESTVSESGHGSCQTESRLSDVEKKLHEDWVGVSKDIASKLALDIAKTLPGSTVHEDIANPVNSVPVENNILTDSKIITDNIQHVGNDPVGKHRDQAIDTTNTSLTYDFSSGRPSPITAPDFRDLMGSVIFVPRNTNVIPPSMNVMYHYQTPSLVQYVPYVSHNNLHGNDAPEPSHSFLRMSVQHSQVNCYPHSNVGLPVYAPLMPGFSPVNHRAPNPWVQVPVFSPGFPAQTPSYPPQPTVSSPSSKVLNNGVAKNDAIRVDPTPGVKIIQPSVHNNVEIETRTAEFTQFSSYERPHFCSEDYALPTDFENNANSELVDTSNPFLLGLSTGLQKLSVSSNDFEFKAEQEQGLAVPTKNNSLAAPSGNQLKAQLAHPTSEVYTNSQNPVIGTRQCGFEPVETSKGLIFLIICDDGAWVSTDEIISVFTKFSCRTIVMKILKLLQVTINFKELHRKERPDLFSQLDRTNLILFRMPSSDRVRGSLHLTPVKSLIKFLLYLKVITEQEIHDSVTVQQLPAHSVLPDILKLMNASKALTNGGRQ